jgi:hypothetical protein
MRWRCFHCGLSRGNITWNPTEKFLLRGDWFSYHLSIVYLTSFQQQQQQQHRLSGCWVVVVRVIVSHLQQQKTHTRTHIIYTHTDRHIQLEEFIVRPPPLYVNSSNEREFGIDLGTLAD